MTQVTQRALRWTATCGVGRRGRAGNLRHLNARRMRKLRVFSILVSWLERIQIGEVISQSVRGERFERRRHQRNCPTGPLQENCLQIVQKSTKTKNNEKRPKKRRKIALGPFWTLKVASGTARDTLGRVSGLEKINRGTLSGYPGRPGHSRTPQGTLGEPPETSQIAPRKRCPRAFGATHAFENGHGSIFRRVQLIVRKLRTVFRVGNNWFLQCETHFSRFALRTPRCNEKRQKTIHFSKIEPGGCPSASKTTPGAPIRAANAGRVCEEHRMDERRTNDERRATKAGGSTEASSENSRMD